MIKKMARPLRPGSGLRAPALPVVKENQVKLNMSEYQDEIILVPVVKENQVHTIVIDCPTQLRNIVRKKRDYVGKIPKWRT